MRPLQNVLVLLVVVIPVGELLHADHGREVRPNSWRQDATINDVFSLNENLAWAVGDQGLILRTTDGGDSWVASEGVGLDLDRHRTLEQKLGNMRPISQTHELYPLTCSFQSVFFLDENRGWVAGTYQTPYLRTSRSVLLTTVDGGKSWYQFKANLLPELKRVHFQDVLGGWAIGRAGNLFDSGVYATSTGGQTWSVQEVTPARNWIDGELVPNGFVVIDDEGVIGRIVGKKFEPSVVFGHRPGQLKAVRMLDSTTGWAVGNNGTILQTQDGGQSWRRPQSFDSDDRLAGFDFTTLNIREGRVWVAGNPGTTIVSFDARRANEIEFQLSSNSTPIQKLYFASRSTGWAVGANGKILSTSDGGSNWRVQRGDSDQAAILIVSKQVDHLPFALLANYSNERDYLSSLVVVGRTGKLDFDLAKFAVNRLGCSTVLNILGDDLNKEQPQSQVDAILKELIRTIRTLRPSVVVCNKVPGMSDNELHVLCRTAIDMASRHDAFPEQMDDLALEPWQIDRYMIRQRKKADINFAGSRYLTRTGKLLEDQVAVSRGLLGLSPRMVDEECYAVESFTGTVSSRQNDVFFGLKQLGRVLPVRVAGHRMGNLNSIATAPLKRQEFNRLLKMQYETPDGVAELHRQIRSFATGIEAQETGIWMMQLADAFLDKANFGAAAHALEELVSRHNKHPFTPAALIWLAQYYSSEEVSTVLNKRPIQDETTAASERESTLEGFEPPVIRSNPVSKQDNGVKLVSWEVEDPDDEQDAESDSKQDSKQLEVIQAVNEFRSRQASRFLSQLKQHDPDFAQDVKIQFMEAMIVDKIPGDTSNGNLLKRIKRKSGAEPKMKSAANRELVVRDNKQRFESVKCYYTQTRPRLDGILDDEVWQQALEHGEAIFQPATPRESQQSTRNDFCWMAYDDQFLFFAARCNKLDELNYPQSPKATRKRDSDLTEFDRIQLKIDVDRDLQSEFLFEVDHRGWACDRCAGAKGWNPEWFIAVNNDERAWSVELAIPLKELTLQTVEQLETGAISLKRLDSTSTNIWSVDRNRRPELQTIGIATGLRLEPGEFQMLQFVPLKPVPTDSADLE